VASNDLETISYAPGWVDRLQARVDRLPVPMWAFYLGMWLALFAVFTLIQWSAGQYAVGTFSPFHMFLTGVAWFALAFLHYLDRRAEVAFNHFLPALNARREEQAALLYKLTTMPARPTLYATLAGGAVACLTLLAVPFTQLTQIFDFSDAPVSVALYYLTFLVSWMVFTTVLYHTYHQLRQINHIYTAHTRVSLFHLRPLYAFSALSARTAIAFAFILSCGIILTPSEGNSSVLFANAVIFAPQLALIPASFLWPLIGIHHLLVTEKERILDQNQASVERTINEVLQRMANNSALDDIDELHKRLQTLETQERILKRIPTWPWQAETLRSVIATMFLPIIVWLIQQYLQPLLP
jgi:hypothetical protein